MSRETLSELAARINAEGPHRGQERATMPTTQNTVPEAEATARERALAGAILGPIPPRAAVEELTWEERVLALEAGLIRVAAAVQLERSQALRAPGAVSAPTPGPGSDDQATRDVQDILATIRPGPR